MDRIFIRNPLTKMEAAYITPEALISRLEEQANHGCGQYYEIYEYRLLSSLHSIYESFGPKDQQHLLDAASARGLLFDSESLAASSQASSEAYADASEAAGECDDGWVDFED